MIHRSRLERRLRCLYWQLTDFIRSLSDGELYFLLAIGGAWMVVLTVAFWGVM